ncbi:hypothetical protein SDC9_94348 [bioreactor metagenome]|uniref:Uncharacterized protein n=1 Tax=bioreactor metagenome TaxID=1076179 RepID=A0A645A3I4_9ZZZZ
MRDGRVCLDQNSVFLAEFDELQRGVADVRQNLVDHRFDFAMIQNVLQVILKEIGNPDCFQYACIACILQGTPNLAVLLKIAVLAAPFAPGLWTVNNHHIDVSDTHFRNGFVDSACGFLAGFCFGNNFAVDEDFFPRNTTGANPFTDAGFVHIGFRGIDMAISERYGLTNCFGSTAAVDKPGSQTDFGYGHSI